MGLYSRGLNIGRVTASVVCGGGGRGAYFRVSLYLGGLIIGKITACVVWGAYFGVSLYLGELIIGIVWYIMISDQAIIIP